MKSTPHSPRKIVLAYSGGIALHVWTIKGFYETIPVEIEEAAKKFAPQAEAADELGAGRPGRGHRQ